MTSESLEHVHLSEVKAEGQHVVRGRRQLAKATEDDFLLSVQLDGTGLVRQDGRDAPLGPGAMALYASTRPYELVFPRRFRQLVVQLPRATLGRAIANPDALTARPLAAGAAEVKILAATLGALHGTTSELSDASRTHIAASIVASLAGALSALPQAVVAEPPDGGGALRARIRAYVRTHLGDSELSPSKLASALGFSRGHLHRVFAGSGETLERFIWRLRLETVRAGLENPVLSGVAINELAQRAGFTSAEHFSRSFRAHFGTTALSFRQSRSR